LKPDFAEACFNRGNVLQELGRLDEAIASYDKAIALKPDHAAAHANRGNVLHMLLQAEDALNSYDRAIQVKPDFAEAYCNRGIVLKDLTRFEEALESYDKAIALKPGDAEFTWNKSLLLLLASDFRNGWAPYESRKLLRVPLGNRSFAKPIWLGADNIAGKTILVHWEQGLGDTIQFCRYLRLVHQKEARILFAPQKSLLGLMNGLDAKFAIVDESDPNLEFDFHVPLLSLPLAFGTKLETIPGAVPYLRAQDRRVAHWKRQLGEHGFKIGIVWQGRPSKVDMGRSFAVAELAGLGRLAGVRLISLQKNEGVEQLARLPSGMVVETLGEDYDTGPDAFLDAAAVMMNLDLVITSDTAIAHLAGALARPAWVALKHVPDWRWLLDRSDSPWYPTLRLFRQTTRGDWQSVFRAMERELAAMTGGGKPAAHPAGVPRSSPTVQISWGELIDKITILEIKVARLGEGNALENVRHELALLSAAAGTHFETGDLQRLRGELKAVNESLWQIEDSIRAKEAARQFDQDFIALARSVYQQNDRRAAIKRDINRLLASELVEEKLYKAY
jgi:tetratricopeptide (TPR) repeat protein